MTPEQQHELQSVNLSVNQIPYVSTPGRMESADWWSAVPEQGNSWVCRDYVEDKAEALRTAGWPVADLLVVLCWTENIPPREYHAVLSVSIAGEIWILDSRVDDIYLWSSPPFDYLWDRMQVAGTNEFRDVARTGLA